MEWCIVGHTLWTVISFYYPELIERLPLTNVTQEVHVFTIRADFDAAIMSVFIAMVIFGRINVINRRTQVFLVIFGSGFVLLQGNRASFISFSLLIFIALKFKFSVVVNYYAKGVLRILILFFAFLGILGISQLTIGEKFIGVTASLSNHQSELAGAGTASARIAAWTQVAQYINSSPARVWFGVGFGSDYMQDSGALRALVNAEQGARTLPRQPHNYWLNTYARLGIIGTGILLILLSQVLMIAAKILRRPNDFGNEQLMASLIFVSLIPVATFGVVLESPFGALALAMSNGFLLSER
jgi:hypothetical protein